MPDLVFRESDVIRTISPNEGRDTVARTAALHTSWSASTLQVRTTKKGLLRLTWTSRFHQAISGVRQSSGDRLVGGRLS